jgi:hypothetical protein
MVVSPTSNSQPVGPGYLFFVWVITFDLVGMGGRASRYATVNVSLRIS